MREAKTTSVSQAFSEAMAAYEDGRATDARRLARRLAETRPEFGGVHYLLGLLALDANQARKAAEHLARAIAITPGQAVLHLVMGRALEQAGDVAEACLHLRTVLALAPGHAEAHARLATGLGRLGKLAEAVAHGHEATRIDPASAEAWNTLGALLHKAGRPDEAAECWRRALELRPGWPAALNNFGVALRDLGRLDEAATVLAGAVELRPDHGPTRANLAAAHRARGDLEQARTHAEAGTRLDPRTVECWLELGLTRMAQGHAEGAAAAFERAVGVDSASVKGWFCLGEIRRNLGDAARAQRAFRRCLKLDPADRHGAALALALAGGGPAPDRAPDAYVRQLFDDYAARFDQSLVDGLDYRGPALLGRAIAETLGPIAGLAVFDIGCGTGLAAEVLKPLAARLDGVDLSPAMIAKAAERGLYDDLAVGEVVEVLNQRPNRYHLIVAADVLVYLGDLGPVMAGAHQALIPGGAFAFTVEKGEPGSQWELGGKHRYAHSEAYVRRAVEEAGFTPVLVEDAATRRDGRDAVPGLVVVARR